MSTSDNQTVNTLKNTLRKPVEPDKKEERAKRRLFSKNEKKEAQPENYTTISDTNKPLAASKPTKTPKVAEPRIQEPFKIDERVRWAFGAFLISLGLYLFLAFLLFFVNLPYDTDLTHVTKTGTFGGFVSRILLKESFGIGSFYFIYVLVRVGFKLLIDTIKINPWILWKYALACLVWMPMFLNLILPNDPYSVFGGNVGIWLNALTDKYTGRIGTIIIIAFAFVVYFICTFKEMLLKLEKRLKNWIILRAERREEERMRRLLTQNETSEEKEDSEDDDDDSEDDDDDDNAETAATVELPLVNTFKTPEASKSSQSIEDEEFDADEDTEQTDELETDEIETPVVVNKKNEVKLDIQEVSEEKVSNEIEHYGLDTTYDPRLDLRDYRFPTLDLLKDYGDGKVTVEQTELEANKNRIVETLANYSISIDKIKATIGPTVTLYEIVPSAGIRISKIKNLEDDIALSLSAIGIRIIAPIPGKGTVGIEVPNQKPKTVSMRSVLASEKFQKNDYALPFGLGKTISNESYIADLAKMPHILMAGATGQGKSVGLNAIIASLLYCKHPAELKFVLVDPKKVELSLFNRIERHYLAKLPDSEEAIITDTRKVVRTLNSLCIEMDNRYELLKDAQVRNIKEYNTKFTSRRLNPNEGHHFMPYIVLVVDEFADLIMTAGKEVERPITRLAQLARAVGIHLIIATQRPSVNIITGTIKANFPARIAFRVISRVDSHTILDTNGADQLIGRGDMLLSTGNDLVRLQCAFIDTPEVESLTEYIGSQRGYPDAYHLPEYSEEQDEVGEEFDAGERDVLFEDAARIIVQTQQGSTSLLQRKLKLGYNRAGRIVDQLEQAGILGPFAGSKTREVKVANEMALDQFLKDLDLNKRNGNEF